MLFVLEGPDLAGKTTLANELCERLDGPTVIFHKGPPTEGDALIEYELPLESYRPWDDTHIVCDRWHIGELIYGPLKRGRSRLDSVQAWHIDLFLQARAAVTVYVNEDLHVLGERYRTGWDDFVSWDELCDVWRLYGRYFQRNVPTAQVFSNVDVDQLIDLGRRYQHRATHLRRMSPTYIGSPWPQFLFVGDRRAKGPASPLASAFMPLRASSGHYLLTVLYMLTAYNGHTRPEIGIVNACEADADPMHIEMIGNIEARSGQPPAIIALGRNATKALTSAGISHARVPHPQFVRRFYHHHQAEYLDVIHQAMTTGGDYLQWRP